MDPGIAFLWVLLLSTLAFVISSLVVLLGILIVLLIVSLGYRTELQCFHRGTRGLFGMIAIVALVQIIIHRGGTGIVIETAFGDITLFTSQGLSMAGRIVARVGILISSTLLFNAAFREGHLMESLSRVKVPFSIILSLDLTLRLIPRMMEDVNEISKAHSMVSGRPRLGKIGRWKRYLSLIRPLFLDYMRSAYQMGLSLELRGFKGKGRWPVRPYRPHWKDAGSVILIMILVLATIYGSIGSNW